MKRRWRERVALSHRLHVQFCADVFNEHHLFRENDWSPSEVLRFHAGTNFWPACRINAAYRGGNGRRCCRERSHEYKAIIAGLYSASIKAAYLEGYHTMRVEMISRSSGSRSEWPLSPEAGLISSTRPPFDISYYSNFIERIWLAIFRDLRFWADFSRSGIASWRAGEKWRLKHFAIIIFLTVSAWAPVSLSASPYLSLSLAYRRRHSSTLQTIAFAKPDNISYIGSSPPAHGDQ